MYYESTIVLTRFRLFPLGVYIPGRETERQINDNRNHTVVSTMGKRKQGKRIGQRTQKWRISETRWKIYFLLTFLRWSKKDQIYLPTETAVNCWQNI